MLVYTATKKHSDRNIKFCPVHIVDQIHQHFFGSTLAKGVREAVQKQGVLGAFTGGATAAAAGITAAIFFGWLAAVIAKPQDKS